MSEGKKVFYLCNGEKEGCEKNTCYKHSDEKDHPCMWTSDVRHAVNFEQKGKEPHISFYEKEAAPGFQAQGNAGA